MKKNASIMFVLQNLLGHLDDGCFYWDPQVVARKEDANHMTDRLDLFILEELEFS
jgi:hypothetical protein